MNSIAFTTYLTSNTDLDETLLAELATHCQTKSYKKGEFLLRQGMKCDYSFFVEKGLVKQYGIDKEGKEHILQFAPEGWFVTDRESMYFNSPSLYFIQAIEQTQVFLINETFISTLMNTYTKFADFNTRLLHNHIRHLTNRIYQLLSASAEERYLSFIKTYPDILLRVPQTMVSSYLGITPESLSRIRKNLATLNFHH